MSDSLVEPVTELSLATSPNYSGSILELPLEEQQALSDEFIAHQRLFGFQSDNVRNQYEHLCFLIQNARDRYKDAAYQYLHNRIFSNYKQWVSHINAQRWCFQKQIRTPFNDSSYGDRNKVQDLVLWLLIWGEASNCRHMPEFLCFLFYRMSQQRSRVIESGQLDADHSQDEWFRQHVIEPAYNIVTAVQIYMRNNNTLKDHLKRPNYDDMNEYFWNRKWLDTGKNYHDEDLTHFWGIRYIKNTIDYDEKTNKPVPIQKEGNSKDRRRKDANRVKMKTFIEKRSWLNLFRSFFRIVELHFFALHILLVLAYGEGMNLRYLATSALTPAALGVIHELLEIYFYKGVIFSLGLFLNICIRLAANVAIFGGLFALFFFMNSGVLFEYAAAGYIAARIAFEIIDVPTHRWIRKWHLAEDRNFESRVPTQIGMRRFVQFLFWVVLFGAKCIYSYYTYISPLITITRTMVFEVPGWAGSSGLTQDPESKEANYILVLFLWIPTIIIFCVDSQIFYSVFIVVMGIFIGVSERVSNIRSWSDIQKRWSESWRNGSRKFFGSEMIQFSTKQNNVRIGIDNSVSRPPLNLPVLHNPPWNLISIMWRNIVEEMRQADMISYHDEQLLHFGHFTYTSFEPRESIDGQPAADGDLVEQINEYFFLPAFVTAGHVSTFIELIGSLQDAKQRKIGGQEFVLAEMRRALAATETMRIALDEAYIAATLLLQIYIKDCDFNLNGGNRLLDYTAKQKLPHSFLSDVLKAITLTVTECISICFDKGYQNIIRKPPSVNDKQKHQLGDEDEIDMERISDINMKPFINAITSLYRLWMIIMNPDVSVAELSEAPVPEILIDRLEDVDNNGTAILLRSLYHLILTPQVDARPHNQSITDRLMFFLSSLNSKMPERQNSIIEHYSWTVLTPYVDELVIYTEEELSKPNADGVTAEFYLQSTHKKEWLNFIERLDADPQGTDPLYRTSQKREWCSYRGQTLLRTVRGMMFYEKATKLMTLLELGKGGLNTEEQHIFANNLARRKFQYVVSCQRYGQFMVAREKRERGELIDRRQLPEATRLERKRYMDEAQKADDIEYIMKKWPHIRVAYVDDRIENGQKVFYSVLVKSAELELPSHEKYASSSMISEYGIGGGIVEVYRICLPGTILVGEGKPENQNHALIFTRGEFSEAIDMNQDNYFEEALKLRNLLEEFDPLRKPDDPRVHRDEVNRPNPIKAKGPQNGILKCAVLGFREHIFTANLMSVGTYMSLMEATFVSMTLRSFAWFGVRMHYGHPDLLDKLFFITRGGVSKSSRMLHVSEDIFAGFKSTLRGGRIFHKEYIQCGKGRDLGFNQLFLFEAKLASGAGEQALARECYRLGRYLDLPRLLSFFYGSVGFYCTTSLMVVSVFALLFSRVLLVLTRIDGAIAAKEDQFNISINLLHSTSIYQMGLLLTLPMLAEIALEQTMIKAVTTFVWMLVTGSPFFFFFHMQTKAFFFNNSVLFGGAKYRATGRGFVLTRDSFTRIYRNFARTHIYPAMKMLFLLIVYGVFQQAGSYFRDTWAPILLVISWLYSPMWFNPLAFDHDKVIADFTEWRKWLSRISASEELSWQAWWITEHEYLQRCPNSTRRWLIAYNVCIPMLLVICALSSLQTTEVKKILFLIIAFGGTVGTVLLGVLIFYKCKPLGETWRYIKFILAMLIAGFVILLLVFDAGATAAGITDYSGNNLAVFLIVMLLTFNGVCKVLVLYGAGPFRFTFVLSWFRWCDALFGVIVYLPWLILSFFGISSLQTRLLYNRAFFKGLRVKELLHGRHAGNDPDKTIYGTKRFPLVVGNMFNTPGTQSRRMQQMTAGFGTYNVGGYHQLPQGMMDNQLKFKYEQQHIADLGPNSANSSSQLSNGYMRHSNGNVNAHNYQIDELRRRQVPIPPGFHEQHGYAAVMPNGHSYNIDGEMKSEQDVYRYDVAPTAEEREQKTQAGV